MKKSQLRYAFFIIASLLCLGATFYALQAPPAMEKTSLANEGSTVSQQIDQAVGMIEDSLQQARP